MIFTAIRKILWEPLHCIEQLGKFHTNGLEHKAEKVSAFVKMISYIALQLKNLRTCSSAIIYPYGQLSYCYESGHRFETSC